MGQPKQREPFVWEIPVGTVSGMRVPGVVFASEALMKKAVEDRAVEQVANVATLPGIVKASYGMLPDIHWGYGFAVGGVAATDTEDGGVISPGGVGFDISCGVRLVRTELEWERDVKPRIDALVHTLGRWVPRGVGTKSRLRLSDSEMDKVLAERVRFPLSLGIGTEEDAEFCEDHGVLDGARPEFVSSRARQRGAGQLGSLGAGNHFLEVQVVEEIRDDRSARVMGLFEGQVCVMFHTGSRGIGHQVCTDYLRDVERAMAELGITVPDRQLACVPVNHPVAERYIGAMFAAANYARANRHVLTQTVRDAFQEVFGRGAEQLGMDVVYDVAHNLAKVEEYEVTGSAGSSWSTGRGRPGPLAPATPSCPRGTGTSASPS